MVTLIQVPQFVAGLHSRVPRQKRRIYVMEWLKADGETVAEGEAVVVLNTVKAAVELTAEASGFVFHLKEVDQDVKLYDVLGVLADSVEEFEEYRKQGLTHVA